MSLERLLNDSASANAERILVDGGALLVLATLFAFDDRRVRVGLGRASFPAALERWERAVP